jgi:hypothetical protein
MPQVTRHFCSNCKQSVYNCMIDGVRIPLIFYFVIGQGADTGPPLDVNGDGVKLPSFIREILLAPVPRVELCIACVVKIFGLDLHTGQTDPMYSREQEALSATKIRAVVEDTSVDEVNTHAIVMERTLLAFQVGRGAVPAPALPPPAPEPEPAPAGEKLPVMAVMAAAPET